MSNSVRMIAPVGQTSMQLACWQCLQTSDIISQALPLPVAHRLVGHVVDELHVPPVLRVQLPGVVVAVAERRLVARQLVPLLAGHLAGLAADADARVGEEPVGLAGRDLGHPEPHQVGCDLRKAVLGRVEVERQRRQLVHLRHGAGVAAQVDVDQVALARGAGVDAKVREHRAVGPRGCRGVAAADHGRLAPLGVDGALGVLGLAARRAGAARVAPAVPQRAHTRCRCPLTSAVVGVRRGS